MTASFPGGTSWAPFGSVLDVDGVGVGCAAMTGPGALSGTTVLLPPVGGGVGGVDVRGGGPATRETDALAPGCLVPTVDAVVLTGGSAYGLDAAGGVQRHLEAAGRGFRVGPGAHDVVPIVPAAALFDLGRGGGFGNRPDGTTGAAAAAAATTDRSAPLWGCAGAGTGAVAGGLKGGLGTASVALLGGVVVAALVAVNARGSAVDPADGRLRAAAVAGARLPAPTAREHAAALAAGLPGPPPLNTTIGVVVTNAVLDRAEAGRTASAAHDGLARALSPVHTLVDGDTLFALSTGAVPLAAPGASRAPALSALHAAAADAVTLAVAHALLAARAVHTATLDAPSYGERYPSVATAVGAPPA